MQLFFEVIDGDREGARFEIRPGMSIGRTDADVLLRDSKISARHAHVVDRAENTLVLVDNKSSNGIKVEGKRVSEVELTPGLTVLLGRTLLKVVSSEEDAELLQGPVLEPWWETLARLSAEAQDRAPEETREVAAFNPLVRLKFLQGNQTGTTWVLGYGPREIGAETLDLRIEEPNSPEVCFELLPHRDGPAFRTSHPGVVKLNGRDLESEFLSDGDVIEIYKTRIKVILKQDE